MLAPPERHETLTRADIKRLRKERMFDLRKKDQPPKPETKKAEAERMRAQALLDGNSVPKQQRKRGCGLIPAAKGEVRNPLGINGVTTQDIASLAKVYTREALSALVRMLSNDRHAVAAAVAILDRGYGKPQQTVENNVNVTIRADELSDDELAKLVGVGAGRQPKVIDHVAPALPSRAADDVMPINVNDLDGDAT